MKVQPYKSPNIRLVPRELSVNRQREILSANSWSESGRFRRTSVSFIEKRQKSSNVEKHLKKDQQSNITSISDNKRSVDIELSKNKGTKISATKKRFSLWNHIPNKNEKLSLGNVNDMKHQSKKKTDRRHRLIKWWCKPSRICCLILSCLLLAGIPIAIIFGLRSRETNKSLTCNTLLNFENLANQTSTTIVNGYGGLNWSKIGTLVAINRLDGYRAAMVSASCVTFNPGAQSGSITSSIVGTTFSLVSFYVSAAWFNETILFIMGSRTGVQLYSTNVMIFTINVTLVTLNWANIDKVSFLAFSPTYNNLTYYSMDNMCLE